MSDVEGGEWRAVGATENSWVRAVPGGTGVTVLALLLSKRPELGTLESALRSLQKAHPILRSRLRRMGPGPESGWCFFVEPESPPLLQLRTLDLRSTDEILRASDGALSPLHSLVEHEMNDNPWAGAEAEAGVLQAKVYELEGGRWVAVLKSHTAACDRAAAVAVLRELLALLTQSPGGGVEGQGQRGALRGGIEEHIPPGKGTKPLWARGVNMLGYSLNSLRLSNLDFVDPHSPRRSQLLRLRLDRRQTAHLLQGCKIRDIKLCGALSAAGLMAARLCKNTPHAQWDKLAVVTLTDCRSMLQPPLTTHDAGFYHSAILNSHDMNGTEQLWDLATRTYNSFRDAKNANKHFTDMADLNFLMCKAIENPGLTPSSSLRTSFISVFEDVVVDEVNEAYEKMGVEDYVGCASVHGVGPTLALFDTIRDGQLDCACMYPAPLHSREQMQELIHHMTRILVDPCNFQ